MKKYLALILSTLGLFVFAVSVDAKSNTCTTIKDGTMSGSWENNTQSETWMTTDGMATREVSDWDYFVKIVTPSRADGDYKDGGFWYNGDYIEIGPVLWGQFAIVQEAENDMSGGLERVHLRSKLSPGIGYYKEHPEAE